MPYDKLNYYSLTDLVEVYCGLVTCGAIFKFSPGGDPKTNLPVIISDVDLPKY